MRSKKLEGSAYEIGFLGLRSRQNQMWTLEGEEQELYTGTCFKLQLRVPLHPKPFNDYLYTDSWSHYHYHCHILGPQDRIG